MTRSYAATAKKSILTPFEFTLPPLTDVDVTIAVKYCALCHSDIHLIDGDWSIAQYPLVPGHEIIGQIIQIGKKVTGFSEGQWVGVGWQSGSCGQCAQCTHGMEHLCVTGKKRTCVNGFGGLSEKVIIDHRFVHAIPDGFDLISAAPLMCAGLTVFSPLERLLKSDVQRVGIIGIGGLGHLAVQIAKAMGAEVYAFDSVPEKVKLAETLGAISIHDPKSAPPMDLILSTSSAQLDWNFWMERLDFNGVFCLVGYPPGDVAVANDHLLDGQKSITGSVIGSPATMRRMLQFCLRHSIRPLIETMPFSRVNEALDRVRAGKVNFRMVLENDWE